jgi:hypothetical protein
LALRGLEQIRTHFSHENCYGTFAQYITDNVSA